MIVEPLIEFSDRSGLSTPRTLLDRLLGRERSPAVAQHNAPIVSGAEPEGRVTPDPTDVRTPEEIALESVRDEPSAPSTDEEPQASLREVTQDDPLRLWVIGDSFVETFGPALRNRGIDMGFVDATVDFRYISGLATPRFFDWPSYIARRQPELMPDGVVVLFGGNDGVALTVDGNWLPPETEPWYRAYSVLVGEAMDLLVAGGAQRVYWVGMPIMRSGTFTERVEGLNSVYESEALKRAEVVYVSSFELFQDASGAYSTYLPDAGGRLQVMRHPDGAHLSLAGGYLLADHLLRFVGDDWGWLRAPSSSPSED